MITDSLGRQFLVMHRHFIRISVIEEELGISGKSLYKWMIGKRPLPARWEQPLYEYLYPLVDQSNKVHRKTFQFDRVVVLEHHQILPQFQGLKREQLRMHHFYAKYVAGADVLYFRFYNRTRKESYMTIYSVYTKPCV